MKKILLKNVKFVEHTFADGSKQLVGLIRGDIFNKLDIPLSPNPRQFLGMANPNYKRMAKTLKEEPELFARKNASGITIFAASCDNNGDGTYTLTLRECDGIANGGHTYQALKQFGSKDAFVKITIEVCLNSVELLEIVESLNMSKKIETYSLKNKRGSFNWHKEALGHHTKEVCYFEGDYGEIKINDSLRVLSVFFREDNEKKGVKRKCSNNQSSSFLRKQLNSSNAEGVKQLKWITKDVHKLQQYIITDEKNVIRAKVCEKRSLRASRMNPKNKLVHNSLCLMVMIGIAHVGTTLNHNNIVSWVDIFKDEDFRKKYASSLMDKIIDIINLEEGTLSELVGNERIREKIMKQSELLLATFKSKNLTQESIFE